MDNVSDGLSTAPDGVESEFTHALRRGRQPGSAASLCAAVHGASYLITARRGPEERTVLFDAGPEEYAFERNCGRLDIDLGTVDAIVLSHGHFDHCGGVLVALNQARQPGLRPRLPVYVHPDMFAQRGLRLPGGAVSAMDPIAGPEELDDHGAEVIARRDATTLLDNMFFLSGEIPRTTPFEPGFPGHVRRDPGGPWTADEEIRDERWLGVHVAGKGVVAFSACSHAGVVNVVRDVESAFGGVPVHAVVGGLHLSGANERHIAETVECLLPHRLASLAVGHCTGWRATAALAAALGDDVVAPSAVGKRYTY